MRTSHALVPVLASLLVAGALASPARADDLLKGRTYHFGTHPARTNVTFVSEADLETIHGVTHQMQGQVTVDATGTKASGALQVSVAAMQTGIDLRDEHMRSPQWLDAARFPSIGLALLEATQSKDGKTWSYVARLTIKGVTKELKGSARIRGIPEEVGKALGEGAWVRVRTDFEVRLSDFGVQIPNMVGAKVSEVWKVGVDLYGTTAAPAPREP